MQILVFADIVGKIGRRALQQVLPVWKERYAPSLVVANVENLAHGAGITLRTVQELVETGVEVMTGGNHLWDKPAYMDVFADKELGSRLVRPLNEVKIAPGSGSLTLERDGRRIVVLNVMGQFGFKSAYPSPFEALDTALAETTSEDIVLVDVHADATSEKALLARYVDGRASAVWGSHTHVPTADERILPGGTAFITDVGLTGAHNESIGVRYEHALRLVKDRVKTPLLPPDAGPAEVNAILLTFGESRFPTSIKRLRELVEIELDSSA